jgi:parallel beta-helix repeat protein
VGDTTGAALTVKKTALGLSLILVFLFSPVAGLLLVDYAAGCAGCLLAPPPESLPVNHAYIRSDGSIDPATTPIERIGNLYVLNDNILNCSITIEKDNVKIDGNGFLMSIPSYGEKGADRRVKTAPALIEFCHRTNITIRNFNFHHAQTAINSMHSSDITITDNTITGLKWGVFIYNSTHSSIIGNTLKSNTYGIYGAKSDNLLVRYNHFSNCSEGILAYFTYSSVIGNIFIRCGQAVKYLEYHNRVVGNTFQENAGGISSIRAHNEIHHNNFIDNLRDTHLQSPNILDDGKEGNYWSSHPYSKQLVVPSRSGWDEDDVDRFPQTSPYIFDYQPPSLSIVLPENKAYVNGDIALIFNASKEISRASYSINGNGRVPLQEDAVLTGLPTGTYSLTVYAEDVFGNEGTATVTFTIIATDDLLTATFAIALAIAVVGIIVYFKKRGRGHSK